MELGEGFVEFALGGGGVEFYFGIEVDTGADRVGEVGCGRVWLVGHCGVRCAGMGCRWKKLIVRQGFDKRLHQQTAHNTTACEPIGLDVTTPITLCTQIGPAHIISETSASEQTNLHGTYR